MADTITFENWTSTKDLCAKIGKELDTEPVDRQLQDRYDIFFETLSEKIKEEHESAPSFGPIASNDTAFNYLSWVITKGFKYGVYASGAVGFKYAHDRQAEEYLSTVEDQDDTQILTEPAESIGGLSDSSATFSEWANLKMKVAT
ncbi:hypothetical protein CYMTET_28538 [Cymbomonas tetramitiformis]|uniref:Uncharacterized protein n=1 Tax=Cymbomonas tetramitiformis TaxID=36881 RepID=A0AAE0FMY4_9CHLO|nr:hypothetical protein CYMTET_28538 [Cymbomonas tetramitiformis]